jgi:hypothetical protein
MSTVAPTDNAVPAHLAGLVDDAATFPPGNAPLVEGARAHAERHTQWYDALVASYVCKDTDLAATAEAYAATGASGPLRASVVLTTGAGGVAPAAALAARTGIEVHALEVAARDLDDPAGNVRRIAAAVDQARAEGHLPEDADVFVELPQGDPTAGWLAAADEASMSELRLKFRTGGIEAHLFPTADQLAAWIDAALDRETPFKCTAGLHNALRHSDDGLPHHGFLNVLLATRRAFDGAGRDDVVATLEQRDGAALLADVADPAAELAAARRWFTSFGSCSVLEPRDDLIALGLLEEPA